MAFHYDVMTKDQASQARYSLLPDGEYSAVIKSASDRMSQAGNPMIELHLDVYDSHNQPFAIRDYLVFNPKMMWKVIHCAESANLLHAYENKEFCPELLANKNVRVFVQSQKGNEIPIDKLNGKPPGSCYPDKNVISDYVENQANQPIPISKPKVSEPEFDDDIPF